MTIDIEFEENGLDPDFALDVSMMINDGVISFKEFRQSLDNYCKYSNHPKSEKELFQSIVEENLK